jgi:TonB-dependent receptor
MLKGFHGFRYLLCASTAFCLAGAAHAGAQNAGAPVEMNLGSVTANGQQAGGAGAGNGAPSGTGSVAQARKLKKLSPNIISVQPQSQIQKLPDVNVAEALQRIPGISMESDTGEGRFINIRGLDADLNGTSYDGVHLTAANQSTPTGGGRAVAFDAFPSGMIGGLEVIKSLTPDMDAEGLGGAVNMLPLTLPDGDQPIADINLAAGEETLRKTGIYQGDLTLGDAFAIPGMTQFANAKPFRFIFNYTNETDRRGIDDVEEDYNSPTSNNQPASLQDLQLRWYQAHRVRQGYGGEFDFDPSPTTSFYARALGGGYDEQIQKNRLELDGLDGSNGSLTDNGGGSYTATGATAKKVFTNSNERIGYNLLAAGGKTVLDDVLTVDFRGSWTQGYDIVDRSYSTTFKDSTPFDLNYATSDANLRTFSVITPGVVSNAPSRSFDQEFGAAADASFATNFLGYLGEAKFGTEARFRSEGTNPSEIDYNVDGSQTLAGLDGGNPNVVYYGGNYSIGPNVAYGPLFGSLLGGTVNTDTALAGFAHNTEDIYALYGQETVAFGKLEVLAGLRMEDTNGTYRANLATTDASGNTTYAPNTNKQDYINLFPSVQLKYPVTDALQLRAAYSTAIARPGFDQITGAESVTIAGASNGENAVSEGNPSLKPTTVNSFDVTAEYYTNHDGLLSINPFYKLFSNYVVATQSEGRFEGAPAQINSYENIGGAYARGLELDAEQKLTFLPAPLDGLGAAGNITFVDSRGRYDTDGVSNELPETSPISYNAQVFYEKGPLELRTAASYVSRNLFTVVGTRDTDQFSSPRFRLDVSGSYQVTRRIQIYAEGKNLTNTKLEFTSSASSAYPIQREYYEQDFLVGIRLKLAS